MSCTISAISSRERVVVAKVVKGFAGAAFLTLKGAYISQSDAVVVRYWPERVLEFGLSGVVFVVVNVANGFADADVDPASLCSKEMGIVTGIRVLLRTSPGSEIMSEYPKSPES